jgi:hypothetical protein
LWRLDDKFNEEGMVAKRSTVAQRLLDKDTAPDRQTEDLLDYFDTIGFLIDRKALDRETAWRMFSDAAFSYWFGAQAYLDANGGGDYWGDFKSLVNDVFVPIEMRKDGIDAKQFHDRAVDRSREYLACEVAMLPAAVTARALTSASSGRARLGRTERRSPPEAAEPAAPLIGSPKG